MLKESFIDDYGGDTKMRAPNNVSELKVIFNVKFWTKILPLSSVVLKRKPKIGYLCLEGKIKE